MPTAFKNETFKNDGITIEGLKIRPLRTWCLRHAGLEPADLDAVAYSYDPAECRPATAMGLDDPWDHLRLSYAEQAPGFIAEALPGVDPASVRFVRHHAAHAAS